MRRNETCFILSEEAVSGEKNRDSPQNTVLLTVQPPDIYLGSNVAENGGTSREVNARIQKARGSFSKLRSEWLLKSLRKGMKIRIFNACVKSVLLYGRETWLVTKGIQRKLQTFVNRCLRYILRIWRLFPTKIYGK